MKTHTVASPATPSSLRRELREYNRQWYMNSDEFPIGEKVVQEERVGQTPAGPPYLVPKHVLAKMMFISRNTAYVQSEI